MSNIKVFLSFVLLIAVSISCNNQHEPALSYAESLIPKPVSVTYNSGSFALDDKTTIFTLGDAPEIRKIATQLAGILKPATGFQLTVSNGTSTPVKGNIYLALNGNANLGDEGYTLNISSENIQLSAAKPAGLFRGIQTIRQLLPPSIEMSSVQSEKLIMPSVNKTYKPVNCKPG